jgi:hypothetical protein
MNVDADQSLRLTFSYDGERIGLTDVRRVPKQVPPTDPVEADLNQSGFWFELRCSDGKPYYRRVVPHPIRYMQEVFPEHPEQPFELVPIPNPKGVFSLVVPELDEAQTLVLMGDQRGDTQLLAKGIVELAKFDLRTIRASIKEVYP